MTSDLLGRGRMLWLDIDRDAASRLGVSMDVIDNALYDALGQRLISTIFTQTNQYKVVLESAPQFRRGPDDIEKIYVKGSEGKPMFFTINSIRLFVNQLKKLIPIDSAAPLSNSLSRYTFARLSAATAAF